MDLTIRSQSVDNPTPWLDSTETLRFLPGGITLDSAAIAADGSGKKIVKSGTPIESQANGKWKVMPAAPTAGQQYAMLWKTLDCTQGDQVGSAIDHGRVREARLPVAVVAAQKAAVPGITFRP